MMQFMPIRIELRSTKIIVQIRYFSVKLKKQLIESCKILGVTETPTTNELKNAFINLARKYHPDSSLDTANAEKFAEIQAAYRFIREYLTELKCEDDKELLEKNFGIKHIVPQHRHYLTNEDVGYGTPSQRQKQYEQHKVNKAMERVYDYRTQKMTNQFKDTLILKDPSLAYQYKTRQAMERLVEDLIQESMARGEFENLPGSGKPMKYIPENPYVDTMTHKLNQILINNGFSPEWVVLEQEIKTERNKLYDILDKSRSHLGPVPLCINDKDKWNNIISELQNRAKLLNMKIDKYNMVVPIPNKQQLHFQLEKEAEKILQTGKSTSKRYKISEQHDTNSKNKDDLFSFFWNLFH